MSAAALPPATIAPSWAQLIAGSGLPRLEAHMLLEAASGRRREWLIAHGDEAADRTVTAAFASLVQRRRSGEPMAWIVGVREFAGRAFRVSPAVLIPRPETEMLVEFAQRHAPPAGRMIDLGTGSGAIAVSVACVRPDLDIVATDCSEAALAIARANAAKLCPDVLARQRLHWLQGCWWDAVAADMRFDLIVANPPYIASADPHLNQGDLRHEPRIALSSGRHGLDALRTIIGGAAEHAAQGARIALEHGHDQGEAVRSLLAAQGWPGAYTQRDAAGCERLTSAGPFR